jgi:hypothetical protein
LFVSDEWVFEDGYLEFCSRWRREAHRSSFITAVINIIDMYMLQITAKSGFLLKFTLAFVLLVPTKYHSRSLSVTEHSV